MPHKVSPCEALNYYVGLGQELGTTFSTLGLEVGQSGGATHLYPWSRLSSCFHPRYRSREHTLLLCAAVSLGLLQLALLKGGYHSSPHGGIAHTIVLQGTP
jgi:hypothetical protein